MNGITPAGCVLELSSGNAPYSAIAAALPHSDSGCTFGNNLPNGSRFAVVAGAGVRWNVSLIQESRGNRAIPPVVISGVGQNIAGPFLLGQGEILKLTSLGNTPFTLDLYQVFENDPIIKRVVDLPAGAIGTWPLNVPMGDYVLVVDTAPGREWLAEIRKTIE